MNPDDKTGEKPEISASEVQRRKRQVWLVAGWMVLGGCLAAILLLTVFAVFGEQIRVFLAALLGR